MNDVTPTELEAAIALIRSGKAPIQLTAKDILDACKLKVVDPVEAHHLLGLPDPVVPAPTQPARKRSWVASLFNGEVTPA